jgi:hypothetical protein
MFLSSTLDFRSAAQLCKRLESFDCGTGSGGRKTMVESAPLRPLDTANFGELGGLLGGIPLG